MRNVLLYGDERIDYAVEFDPSRQDKIAINVQADGSVTVDAPVDESRDAIHAAVRKRSRWIVKNVQEAKRRFEHVQVREYVSGESVLYLGRRYVLKVVGAGDQDGGVKLVKGRLQVTSDDKSPNVIKGKVKAWYRFRAQDYFRKRLAAISQPLPWVESQPPLQLLAMTKQWGSCGTSGSVILNPSLVKAPRDCVDYVILHELCHLKEHNHSPRFYELLDRHTPGWRATKTKLDAMAEIILNE